MKKHSNIKIRKLGTYIVCKSTSNKKDKTFSTYKTKRYKIIENSKEINNELKKEKSINKSIRNEYDRHIEHSQLTENSLYKRAFIKPLTPEEIILKKLENEELHIAISKLPNKQKERIIEIYFNEKSTREVAENEGVSMRMIQKSVAEALEKLKKFLK